MIIFGTAIFLGVLFGSLFKSSYFNELKTVMDISSLNKEDYTEESWNQLEEAISKAEVCLESGTQEEVDACVSEIQSAKDGLVIKEKQESIIVKIIKVIVNWIKKLFPW